MRGNPGAPEPGDDAARLLIWSIEPTGGFDAAWASIRGATMAAEGRASGLLPVPFWLDYRLETSDGYVTSRMVVTCRTSDRSAALDLRRDGGRWTVDGTPRPDLDGALDCDLMACPLTNTMPILRHVLHEAPGDEQFLMAFIEVPSLRVVRSPQRYTWLKATDDGALVRFRSGSFQSDLTIDRDGFVVDYPSLGRRLDPPPG